MTELKSGKTVATRRAFTVQHMATRGPNCTYRVYFDSGALYFVPLGKPATDGSLFFSLSFLLALFMMHRQTLAEEDLVKAAAAADAVETDELLERYPNSFKLTPDQITECRIDPPRNISGLNDFHAGRWVFKAADGRSFDMKMEPPRDARPLVAELSALLGERLEMDLEWDNEYQRYRKPKRKR